jgi:hypothetical protein
MFSDYIAAVENHLIRYPRIQQAYNEHRYCVGEGSLVATSRGEVPIESVELGDFVATRDGWRRVVNKACNGKREALGLVVNGRILRVTGDHLVATPDGWLPASALVVGSLVHFVALTAPSSPIGFDFGVCSSEPMSTLAVGLDGLSGDGAGSSPHIGEVGDGFQMVGVAAGSVATEMVDFGLGRDVAFPGNEGHSVGQPESFDVAASIAKGISGSGPKPATSDLLGSVDDVGLVIRDGTHPVDGIIVQAEMFVWDLTVEGAHEFVAEGVVVHNCTMQDLFGSGHPPDSVVAGAVAWAMRPKVGQTLIPLPITVDRADPFALPQRHG